MIYDKAAQQEVILDFFARFPDSTNRECAKALGMEPSTVSARRNELMKVGVIKETGKKRLCSITGVKVKTWRTI
jgi:DNA-binding Lrp family transcriptional regulator